MALFGSGSADRLTPSLLCNTRFSRAIATRQSSLRPGIWKVPGTSTEAIAVSKTGSGVGIRTCDLLRIRLTLLAWPRSSRLRGSLSQATRLGVPAKSRRGRQWGSSLGARAGGGPTPGRLRASEPSLKAGCPGRSWPALTGSWDEVPEFGRVIPTRPELQRHRFTWGVVTSSFSELRLQLALGRAWSEQTKY